MAKKNFNSINSLFFSYSANLANLLDPKRHFRVDMNKAKDLQIARILVSLSLSGSLSRSYGYICSFANQETGLLLTSYKAMSEWCHMRRLMLSKLLDELFDRSLIVYKRMGPFRCNDTNIPSAILIQLLPIPSAIAEKVSLFKEKYDSELTEVSDIFLNCIPYSLPYKKVEEIRNRIRSCLRTYSKDEIVEAVNDRKEFFNKSGGKLFSFSPVEDVLPRIRFALESNKRKDLGEKMQRIVDENISLKEGQQQELENLEDKYLNLLFNFLPVEQRQSYLDQAEINLPIKPRSGSFLKNILATELLKKDIIDGKFGKNFSLIGKEE